MLSFSEFLYKSICCGYSFELHWQVDVIQMGTHSICLNKVAKNYTGCNLKTTELLECALIGICVVIKYGMLDFSLGRYCFLRLIYPNTVKPQWLKHQWVIYCGWFKPIFESLGNSSRKQIFRVFQGNCLILSWSCMLSIILRITSLRQFYNI